MGMFLSTLFPASKDVFFKNAMYIILCIYLHIYAVKNTTICQIVALCNT